jgi:S-adenosylmethionine:tRNA ribosyltransferase-isomerase
VIEKGMDGHVRINLETEHDIDSMIDKLGKTPLPPYIKREPVETDRERYQTVYAQTRGAVAAPTAGLHFTYEMLNELSYRGVKKASVTLHVGIGTFRPLSENEAKGDKLHREFCSLSESTVTMIKECRGKNGRVIAVGTTTARVLESASTSGEIKPFEGWTDIFIKPPYKFKSVDSLITNFHLPRSSLLMMVCAFGGRERILSAYQEAIKRKYRFYSYGDAMFIIGGEN